MTPRVRISTIIRWVVVLLGVVAIGGLALRDAALRTFPPRSPSAVALAPDDPRVVLATRTSKMLTSALTKADYAAVRGALRAAPLADEPFLIAGAKDLIEKRNAEGVRLIEVARHRDPRNRLSHILLMDQYIRGGRTKDAVEEIAVLTRLLPDADALLGAELGKLALDPKTRPGVESVLRENPLLFNAMMIDLVKKDTSPQQLYQLAATQPRAPAPLENDWRMSLITSLVAKGRFSRARATWANLNGIDLQQLGPVYDPDFRGKPGEPPFDWELSGDETGVAEPIPTGGLDVTYYGRASGNLARQLLTLAPGRYGIQFVASGNASGKSAQLQWTVVCAQGDRALGTMTLAGIEAAPKRLGGSFVVPAGCNAQWLTLKGTSGEFPETQAVQIIEFRIARIAGGQS